MPIDAIGQSQTFNILTEDNERPGFGDLVSNWYAALFLVSKSRQVNFYVSPAMHKNFGKLEPDFNSRLDRQMIRGIQVFAHANDDPDGNETLVSRRSKEMADLLRPDSADVNVCNLAFTARPSKILRDKAYTDRPDLGKSAFGFKVLNRAASIDSKVIPLLVFLPADQVVENERLLIDPLPNYKNPLDIMAPLNQENIYPFYFMGSSFENRHLFITQGKSPITPNPPARDPNFDFQGFAHESPGENALEQGRDLLQKYIFNIIILANEWRDKRFLLVITPGPIHFPITHEEIPVVVEATTDTPGVEQTSPPYREFVYGKYKNLTVRQYSNGIPFRQADAYIASSNLPLLMTGTMSLSQAIQHEKPFYYELHNHHGALGIALAKALINDNKDYWRILMPLNLRAEEYIQGNDRIKKPNFLSRRLFLLNPDKKKFEQSYQAVKARIENYRERSQKGLLLDNLDAYCHLARQNFIEIRHHCEDKEGKGRQQCIGERLSSLKPIIDNL